MAHDYDPDDTATRRTKRDKIERLRTRVRAMSDTDETVLELRGILQGVLDLLEDEL